ncbi:MAG: hypothetical protein HY885_04100 [Deltaproteobacteria bacterium]|nr:hypothetical protein [Deltaproteobacteria bacterium]
MDTDEYEISIAHEIDVCQRVIRKTRESLRQRELRFGTACPPSGEQRENTEIPGQELRKWREDMEALPQWEQRLEEYNQALVTMRVSSARS